MLAGWGGEIGSDFNVQQKRIVVAAERNCVRVYRWHPLSIYNNY